jgi:hypothetical protein
LTLPSFFSILLLKVNWDEILKTLGSTALLMAILGFLAKTIIDHFFSRALETHKEKLKQEADKDVESFKTNLKREADVELAVAKARTELELTELKARTDLDLAKARERADEALLAQKAAFDRQMATFQAELATRTARAGRIREEIVHWANPILGSVMDLKRRLGNILHNEGYFALSPETAGEMDAEWSIRYDYFLPSTVYFFCQYFCWVRLLEESLSFELFEKHEAKDIFLESIHAVGINLSAYPLDELRNLAHSGDSQVFNLQQRAVGEAVAVREGTELRCMRYSEFLMKWTESDFTRLLDPLTRFIDRLRPTNERRWKRLELMENALEHLHQQCIKLLAPNAG